MNDIIAKLQAALTDLEVLAETLLDMPGVAWRNASYLNLAHDNLTDVQAHLDTAIWALLDNDTALRNARPDPRTTI